MRTIKFRAWIKSKKQFFLWDDWSLYGIRKFFVRLCHFEKSDVELLQFTGLKDKNRREIYEGDICEYTNSFGDKKDSNGKDMKYGVVWNKKDAGFEMAGIYLGNYFVNGNDSIELIGNIYENPELCGGK